jgi:hypothetical protein
MTQLVRFLADYDLVDEAPHGGGAARNPDRLHAGEMALQGLQEAHEVPHGEHVVFEEHVQALLIADGGIERILQQSLTDRRDLGQQGLVAGGTHLHEDILGRASASP